MSKTLFLLRHAKAVTGGAQMSDRERPLDHRGEEAARAMGRAMNGRGWVPEAALVSPATRTRQTWAMLAPELDGAPAPAFPQALYPGSVMSLLSEATGLPDETNSAIIVGHNPSIGELAVILAGTGSDPHAVALVEEKFPTAALAKLDFDGNWRDLAPGKARLTDCLRPKDLD